KVLEAMSMALPVVLTSGAASGIAAKDGRHFRIADSDDELAVAAVRLLTDHRRARIMGQAARRFVTEHVSWQSALSVLPELVGWRSRVMHDAA
ncbi:MAG: glycosyltransferase, partial [Novosphingobium sp.]|nr:glycosyltransferase [Novosphingobium sp.]